MKAAVILLILSLATASVEAAQKRKKTPPRPRARATKRERASSESSKAVPRVIGSQVVIVTKNGDRITGELLDLTAYSVRIRSDNLESTHALDTISSLSFSQATGSLQQQSTDAIRPEFSRDMETALNAFQAMLAETGKGTDYTDYGRQLSELRRAAERFIEKYSSADAAIEARAVALVAGALTDYTWARTIWTLKLGRSGSGTVSESDSPAVADAVALYPDLRASSASGDKLSGDNLVTGLWKKAAEKIERARMVIGRAR